MDMYVCMYVCMCICMYVLCVCVCVCVLILTGFCFVVVISSGLCIGDKVLQFGNILKRNQPKSGSEHIFTSPLHVVGFVVFGFVVRFWSDTEAITQK